MTIKEVILYEALEQNYQTNLSETYMIIFEENPEAKLNVDSQ